VDRSDVQETLASLYLRLNGYLITGFIVHALDRVTTEMDVLAVRFPSHQEPEREVQCCQRLAIPSNQIDFIVGEVKGGEGTVNFNVRFRANPGAIKTVLRRFGAFDDLEIARVTSAVPALLDPTNLRRARGFPALEVAVSGELGPGAAKLRFIPFATEQERCNGQGRPYLFVDDLLDFVWLCFRPEQRRQLCDDHYNYELWGPPFIAMVQHFKDPNRHTPGTIEDLYRVYGV
jgi:hypothetical protein